MPGTTLPGVHHYEHPPVTQAELEWADLAVIDLSKARSPEGRLAVAKQTKDAMKNVGFFYVINHGYSSEQTERMFDIGDIPFTQTQEDEKTKYRGKMKDTGSYQGYKPRSYWHIDNGVHDSNEAYNINRDVTKKEHPAAMRPVMDEIDSFARFNHEVLHELLRLLALGLELPEDAFVNIHQFDAVGESFVRFMKYYPRPEDDETKTKGVWLKGHTDFGSITILWSQPVSALQILSPADGKWRWVQHFDNALVINAGDMMEFLSGGFYKATIHRVVQPPPDQRRDTRLGLFYFALPDDDVKLSVMMSPVLQKEAIKRRFEEGSEPGVEEWRQARTRAYGQSVLRQGKDAGIEEETIKGVTVKHYN